MMIVVDLIAYDFMTDFNGIERHFPVPFYPAGIYDADSPEYKFGPDSTSYPTLTLPCGLYDEWGGYLPDGFYTVMLSPDMKYLYLLQSGSLKARVRVQKVIEQMFTNEELNEETEILGRLYTAQHNKKLKDYREAQEDLTAFRERNAANSYAEILDSGSGYYILNYKYDGKKAIGIIQK